jgi:hypothetical protein
MSLACTLLLTAQATYSMYLTYKLIRLWYYWRKLGRLPWNTVLEEAEEVKANKGKEERKDQDGDGKTQSKM